MSSFGYDDDERRGRGNPRNNGGDEELNYRLMEANRRMEDSSFQCVRVLNETMSMATDTTEELERQDESLNRTETRLDEMEVDLEASRRNMREVKSVFGSFVNRFSKPKLSNEPPPSSKSSKPPPSKHSSGQSSKKQQQAQQTKNSSTGNEVVDRNLDALELGLKQLEGQAFLIGHQLDESSDQIDRVRVKMDRNDVRMKNITREAKRQL